MRYFSFSLLISAGALLGHFYMYRRIVRPLAPSRRVAWWFGSGLVAITLMLLGRGAVRSLHPQVRWWHDVFSGLWIAFALSMVLALAAGDVVAVGLAVRTWLRKRRAAPAQPVDVDRRRIAKALPLTVLAGGSATALYGGARAFSAAEVSEVPIRLPRLPRALDGLTIVQLTDIHVGTFIGRRFLDRLVDQVNALRPDVVAITGDLVDGSVSALGHAVAAFGNLRPRMGSFFVTGNHEYFSGVGPWVQFLPTVGVQVLRNRHVSIGDAGASFDLVGVDDWGGRRRGGRGYDLDAALAGRDPDRAAVLLAHQPRNFREAATRGVGLQLSGHTHGGQMFPMTVLVGLEFEHHRGLYRQDDAHIYVSRGCGFWGPPSRVGSPPEIVKVTLTS